MAYEEKYSQSAVSQNVILENRARLSVTGVKSVSSSDDSRIVLETLKGILNVTGSNLHMERLSLDGGEASVSGCFDGIFYESSESERGGFFSRLFR